MKTLALYNQDGTLSTEAKSLISNRPIGMTKTEWSKILKEFKSKLSESDINEFDRLRKNFMYAKYRKTNYETFKESNRKWLANNPEKKKELRRKQQEKNIDYMKQYNPKWRTKNADHVKEYNKTWRQLNINHVRAYSQEYEKKRRAEDPIYRFQNNIRVMCRRVVKELSLGKKPTNTEKWIGCTADELATYFESLFEEGMSWENCGEWHIDHIRPICSFLPHEWQQVNHYTNLRPLWSKDNLAKIVSDKQQSVHN